ncbi:alpha/beta hydrolase [Micrococcus flavus]
MGASVPCCRTRLVSGPARAVAVSPEAEEGPPVRMTPRPVDRVRLRDLLRPPAPPRDTRVLTGQPARVPVRRDVTIADPSSGARTALAVWSYGPVASRAGQPSPDLVFVHGFRGDHHGLALLADCLPERAVLSVELPGFGASPAFPHAAHSVAHHADALRQVLAAARPTGTAVLVGHSYGSVVAARAVADARAAGGPLADALVLLNPIAEPALDASGSRSARLLSAAAQAWYEAAARLPERAGRALLGAPPIVWATTAAMTQTRDRAVLAYTHDQHRRHFSSFASARMLSEAYRGSSRGSVLDAAAHLDLPVLLIGGVQDPMGSPAAQHALAEHIRLAGGSPVLHLLDGVGHLLHYERPAECASLIRTWLSRADP